MQLRRAGRWRRSFAVMALVAVLPVQAIMGEPVAAAPGDLDSSFGEGGKVELAFPSGAWVEAEAVAFTPDGGIVVTGSMGSGDDEQVAVLKLDSNGDPDHNFHGGGQVSYDLGAGRPMRGRSVDVTPTGKIVIGGEIGVSGDYDAFALRLDADGTVDRTFGSEGLVVTNVFASAANYGGRAAVLSDGRVALANWNEGSGGDTPLTVAMFTVDGDVDTAFGVGGLAEANFADEDPARVRNVLNTIAVDASDRIYLGGHIQNTSGQDDSGIARFTPSGVLDSSFGGNGLVLRDSRSNGSNDWARSIAPIPGTGTIVVADYSDGGSGASLIADDGSLISSVGFGGTVIGVAAAPAGGTDVYTTSIEGSAIRLRAFNESTLAVNGSFGSSGVTDHACAAPGGGAVATRPSDGSIAVMSPCGGATYAFLAFSGGVPVGGPGVGWGQPRGVTSARSVVPSNEVLVQSDGKIVVAGTVSNFTTDPLNTTDVFLARFEADGDPDPTFGGGGWLHRDVLGDDDVVAAALDSSDGIVVVTRSESGGDNEYGVVVTRFDADGTRDVGFNYPLGYAVLDSLGEPILTVAHDLAIDSAGRLLVAGQSESDSGVLATVVRLSSTGAFDPTFSLDGFAYGGPSGATANAVLVDGDKVVVAGTDGSGDPLVMRFTGDGGLDPSFATGGVLSYSFASFGAELFGITKAADGNYLAGAQYDAATANTVAFHYIDGTGPVINYTVAWEGSQVGDFRWFRRGMVADASGRAYFPGTTTVETVEVAAATAPPLSPDGGFGGGNGVASTPAAWCDDSAPNGIGLATDKVLVANSCFGTLQLTAFEAEVAVAADPVQDLAVSVDPSTTDARLLDAGIHEINRTDIMPTLEALVSNPVRNSPVRNSPVRNSPVRNSPVRNSPVRNSPVRNSPVRNSELPPILLSSIPLTSPDWPGGWQQLLNTPGRVPAHLLGLPPQSVTLQELPDESLAGITLDQIDLTATPVRNSAVGSLLYGSTTLAAIPVRNSPVRNSPVRNSAWCDALANTALPCPVDEASWQAFLDGLTLFDLELAGVDLQPILWSEPLSLLNSDLDPDSPLANLPLEQISLVDTPLGGVFVADVPSLVDASCLSAPPGDCHTLADAQELVLRDTGEMDNRLDPTATLNDFLVLLRGAGVSGFPLYGEGDLTDLTLGQLVAGLIPAEDFPWERVPLHHLLAYMGSADAVDYTVSADVLCAVADDLELTIELAAGASPQGLGTLTVGSSSEPVGLEPTAEPGTYRVESNLAPVCPAVPGARAPLTLTFAATPAGDAGLTDTEVAVTDGVFTATVQGAVLQTVDADEATNNDLVNPPVLGTNRVRSGHISSPGDVDYFKVPAPAEGSQVTIYLSHMPADYDAVLFGPGSLLDAQSAPVRNSPVRNSPVRNSPVRNSPLEDDGFDSVIDGTNLTPETLADIPVRNSPVRNSPVRNSGIDRGLGDEVLTTTIRESDVGEDLILQVSGYDGASSDQPYVLRVKVTPPVQDLPCIARPYALTSPATHGTNPASLAAGRSDGLILWNPSRLQAMYPASNVEALRVALEDLAEQTGSTVLRVDAAANVQAAYVAWDQAPCSIERANDVVGAVNTLVDSYRAQLSGLQSITIVGGDEVLPHARIPDLATLANQRDYRSDVVFNGFDNAISRAFARGNILSDDPYGDFNPAPWLDGTLYVPDVALGRLVETPEQIADAVTRFLDPQVAGVLDPSTSFTAGYDFLADGAIEVDRALRSAAAPTGTTPTNTVVPPSQINDDWTAQAVIDAWNASPRLVSVNAHYDHYRALPAEGNADTQNPAPELLTSEQLASSALAPGSLLFTMGCNAGVSVADVVAMIGSTASPGPRARDWAQVATEKAALFAGNGGYGYGDTEVVAYSEAVYANFARNIASRTMTIGQAFALAKHQYLSGLGVAGVYDAKAAQEAIFFGLPMYRIGTGSVAGEFMPVLAEPTEPPTIVSTSTPFDVSPMFSSETDPDRGTYWLADGQTPQVTHGRPITPRLVLPLDPVPGQRAHGVVLEDLESEDELGVDPVYAVPTRDLEANEPEPVVDEVFFPSTFTNLTHTETGGGTAEKLVLLPGQFFTPDGVSTGGSGTQRLFTQMTGKVLHSDSTDFDAPEILRFDAATLPGSIASFAVETVDTDVDRIVVLFRDELSDDWKSAELAPSGANLWTGSAAMTPGADEVVDWLAQAADHAGNVGVSTNKGRFFSAAPIPPAPVNVVVNGNVGANGFYTSTPTISLVDRPAGVEFRISVDGAAPRPFDADGTESVSGEGLHAVVISTSAGQSFPLSFAVDTESPVVEIRSPQGSVPLAVHSVVLADYSCADPASGLASCVGSVPSGSAIDTSTGGTKSFSVVATDLAGHVTTETVSYVVGDTAPPAITIASPVDGAEVEIGSSVVADYACDDGTTGTGVVSCVGSVADGAAIDTSTPGDHSFTVTARDRANNTSMTTVRYRVVYRFEGFLAPLNSGVGVFNVMNAGSTAPVKFRLRTASGALVTSVASIGEIRSAPVACVAGEMDPVETTSITASSSLTWTGDHFLYNWKTQKAWAKTCRKLVIPTVDGVEHVVLFKFPK